MPYLQSFSSLKENYYRYEIFVVVVFQHATLTQVFTFKVQVHCFQMLFYCKNRVSYNLLFNCTQLSFELCNL